MFAHARRPSPTTVVRGRPFDHGSSFLDRDDDEIATYEIKSVWALQFHEELIDSDTYVRKIEDTMDVDAEKFGPMTPSSPPAELRLGGRDAEPDPSATSLLVEFNHATTWAVDPTPSDGSHYSAPYGFKFVVVQVRIHHTDGLEIYFDPLLLELVTEDGDHVQYSELEDYSNPLRGEHLEEGDTVEGWTLYRVPKDATRGDLEIDQSVYQGDVACDFERNYNLGVAISLGGLHPRRRVFESGTTAVTYT